ncbi:MAG: ribosome-recycling factor [Candidatus Shikimatogenerans sp. JK-2022]|nr:ribosome-recycling factor [Candidatus Shikimatogenerans bostrichidophilus]
MNNLIKNVNKDFNKIIKYFKEYLNNIHFGKANIFMLKNIKININNKLFNIYDLANINLIDNTTFKIIPYNKVYINNIKKSLLYNKIGSNINVNKDNSIILKLFLFTEEKRLELIENIKKELEKNKNSFRLIRNKYNNNLKKNYIFSKDEIKNIKIEIQNIYNKNILILKVLFNKKKEEILNINN